MYRDSTVISSYNDTCIQIVDDQTLIVYNPTGNTTTDTLKLISDKYYVVSSKSYDSTPQEGICYTVSEINTLPSRYDFLHPIYSTMAILSAVLIFYFAYRLIIYPFFRRSI